MALFDRNLHNLLYLKSYTKSTALLMSLSSVHFLFCMQQKEIRARTQRGILPCHSYTILLITVKNNRRHYQNHNSRQITGKYFLLVSWRIIFGKSQFTASNEIMIYEKKLSHSQIKKYPLPPSCIIYADHVY